jgi:hypothetical protein
MGDELIHERGGSKRMAKRGSKGGITHVYNSTHFPKFVIGI